MPPVAHIVFINPATLGHVDFESGLRDGLQLYWAVCMHHSKADSAAADLV